MTTGLDYNSYVKQICVMAALDYVNVGGLIYPVNYTTDPTNPLATDEAYNPVQVAFPQMITYAENRMCRDLDFLFTSVSLTNYSLTAGSRSLTIPEGTIVVSDQINIITDSGQTKSTCTPVTKEFLDAVYTSSAPANRGKPRFFVPFNDNVFLFGPVPDQNYPVEIIATYRPASLSASNTTTFISLYLPDVFIMASMVYLSAYQRNFGRQNDDPQMAQSYEGQYKALLAGAGVEEARKKFEASGWTSQSPSPVATPTRG